MRVRKRVLRRRILLGLRLGLLYLWDVSARVIHVVVVVRLLLLLYVFGRASGMLLLFRYGWELVVACSSGHDSGRTRRPQRVGPHHAQTTPEPVAPSLLLLLLKMRRESLLLLLWGILLLLHSLLQLVLLPE